MNCDLVSFPVRLLDGRVIAVLVRDKERSFDVATVRVFAFTIEHFFVEFNIVIINGVVESDSNHLGNIFGLQVSRNRGTVFGTEAVWQRTLTCVTRWRSVWVIVNIYDNRKYKVMILNEKL